MVKKPRPRNRDRIVSIRSESRTPLGLKRRRKVLRHNDAETGPDRRFVLTDTKNMSQLCGTAVAIKPGLAVRPRTLSARNSHYGHRLSQVTTLGHRHVEAQC